MPSHVGQRAGPIAPLAVLALSGAYFALFVGYGFNLDDEGTLLAQFERTYRGELPYLDFHMGYTPIGHYFHALLFRVFGVSVLPLRWALVLVHATVAALLFAIGRRVMSTPFAVLPPLIYGAIMPFYAGEFASFNIPYPAWYCVLCFLAGTALLLRFVESRHLGWIAASGLMGGVCFAFKPNVGLFQLAGAGLVLLATLEPPQRPGRSGRWRGALWWALAIGLVGGLLSVFAAQASRRDLGIFLLPIAVVVTFLAARRLAGRPRDELGGSLLVVGLAYVLPMVAIGLPWILFFLSRIGVQRFSRQILFLGTGFEQFYYRAFHVMGSWDWGLLVAAVALTAAGLLARARRIPLRLAAMTGGATALAAGLMLARADMPEGLHAAVVSRTEDMSFMISLLVHWAGIAAVLPLLWRRRSAPKDLAWIVILVNALAMYLQLYPRSDFMHIVTAAPLTMVLGAALAERFAGWLPREAGAQSATRLAIVSGVLCFTVFRVAPNLSTILVWNDGPAWRPQARLDLERAPLTLERGRALRLQGLRNTVDYLRANTNPGEPVFPFPAIEMLCFLADRPNATRHGYFFPGWPGHDIEAEVVTMLTAAPPRLVVVLHAHQYFFLNAPVYYYRLRSFVQRHYRQVAQFNDFAVLARLDVPDADLTPLPVSPPPALVALTARYEEALRGEPARRLTAARALVGERLDFAWEPAVALLADPDPRVREAVIDALASVTDEDISVPLAVAVIEGRVPAHQRLAVLRHIWGTAGTAIVRSAIDLLASVVDHEEREIVLHTLATIAGKLAISDHWFGSAPADDYLQSLPGTRHDWRTRLTFPYGDLPGSHRAWREYLADPYEDIRLRLFLARVLPKLGDRAAIPALEAALASNHPRLVNAAAAGLLRLRGDGRAAGILEPLARTLVAEPMLTPSLMLSIYRTDPAPVRRKLLEILSAPLPIDRAAAAWIISATGDPHFRAPLLALLRSDDRMLRLAAVAGLGHIADPRTRPAIVRALDDPDYEVQDLAMRTLAIMPTEAP